MKRKFKVVTAVDSNELSGLIDADHIIGIEKEENSSEKAIIVSTDEKN